MDAMLPKANLPGFQNNLIRPFTTSRDWDQYIARVDYQVTPKDNLFVRFSQQPRNGISAPLAATSINHNEDFKFINGGVGWTRIWSPQLTSETRFGDHYERLLLQSQPLATLPTLAIRGFGSVQPPPDRLPVVNHYGYFRIPAVGLSAWVSIRMPMSSCKTLHTHAASM